MSESDKLRYPIGQFEFTPTISASQRRRLIEEYERSPDRLDEAAAGLTDDQIDTVYRPGGWTVRQVIHHLPESHMNAYVRLKLALTEELHRSVVADEAAWADLADSREGPIAISLALFRVLQQRWAMALRAMSDADSSRKVWHPAWGTVPLDYLVQVYAWHARHHTAHITTLRDRMGWWSTGDRSTTTA